MEKLVYFVSFVGMKNGKNVFGFARIEVSKEISSFDDIVELAKYLEKKNSFDNIAVILNFKKLKN